MPFVKRIWKNRPNLTTAIDAAALNRLETQYDHAMEDVRVQISDPGTPIGAQLSSANAEQIADSGSLVRGAAAQVFPTRPPRPAFTYAPAPTAWANRAVALESSAMLAMMTSKTKCFNPVIVPVPPTAPNRLGNFYMYWSTDHDNTGGLGSSTGGVWMAYAQEITGPWTVVSGSAASNAIYVDTVQGDQTEGPEVICLAPNSWLMYYQQRYAGAGAQTTMVATSTDGRAWTRVGPALNWPSSWLPGDGHTGYAKVSRIGDRFIAYSLAGGTNRGYKAVWHSSDGLRFALDRRLTGFDRDLTDDKDHLLMGIYVLFEWRGEVWGETLIQTPAAGGTAPSYQQAVVGRMRADLRGFQGGYYAAPFTNTCYVNDGDTVYGVTYGNNGGKHGVILSRLEA